MADGPSRSWCGIEMESDVNRSACYRPQQQPEAETRSVFGLITAVK